MQYLHTLGIKYVFGIPGGAIEPMFDALARSERSGGPQVIVARHETGAAFMADGYARTTGKLGVCCATTGPGTTNLITGVASAYENSIPMLVITAQTALHNFGRRAFQESADTGVNVVGMMQFCTGYNTMVSHADQFEHKLISAIMIALNDSCPTHISIPVDVLKTPIVDPLSCDVPSLITSPRYTDESVVEELYQRIRQAKKTVLVIGAKCREAISVIQKIAFLADADIVNTPDGKGLISPNHPLFRGVIGFGGHESAYETLSAANVDLVIAAGTTLGEWSSNGWDAETLLNRRLIHIDPWEKNLTRSPMARMHVRGNLLAVFQSLLARLESAPVAATPAPAAAQNLDAIDTYREPPSGAWKNQRVKPQWLMHELPQIFPPCTRYFADTGNSMAWAIHHLHPRDRRIAERRGTVAQSEARLQPGRRNPFAALFQVTVEFSSMGWAIGASVGAAFAEPEYPVVCITGDGSMLMSGQEITVALQHKLPVIYIVLNDAALGMVKHGQRLAGAEPIGIDLPPTNFAAMARAMGVNSHLVDCPQALLDLRLNEEEWRHGPLLLDVLIDGEEVPPIGLRLSVLKSRAKRSA